MARGRGASGAGGAATDATGWIHILYIYIPDTAAVSFPIKSPDEFDISMTYLLLSARKMFAEMSENLNFIYYSAPSRAAMPPYRLRLQLLLRGHAQFRFQLQHNWRPLLQRLVARCRQCNVIRASTLSYLSGLLRSLRTLFPFLLFQLVFLFFYVATWVGSSGLRHRHRSCHRRRHFYVCTSSSCGMPHPACQTDSPTEILRFSGRSKPKIFIHFSGWMVAFNDFLSLSLDGEGWVLRPASSVRRGENGGKIQERKMPRICRKFWFIRLVIIQCKCNKNPGCSGQIL